MKKSDVDYQKLHEELEGILESLQHENLEVDKAMRQYERGLEIVGQLESYLTEAENTVQELQAKFSKE